MDFVEYLRKIKHTIIPLQIKYGKRFRQVFKFLMEHQKTSREELDNYQWQKLKQLLDYSYKHVPFYQKRFDSIGMHPNDIKNRDDYTQIPILTREDVVEHIEELKSDEFKKFKPYSSVTSGTTRDRMPFFRSYETEVWRLAVTWRHYFNIGYKFREQRAELLCPLPYLNSRYHMPIDHNENALLIDPTSITKDHCPKIHARLLEVKPKILFCHPGTTTSLVLKFHELGLPPIHIPTIYCIGELIYPDFRNAIESFFQGRIIEYYANRENSIAAMELFDGNMYIQSDYCYLEFINDDGKPIVNEQAEVISTSLVNLAFPFIRYQTDDIGIYRGHIKDALVGFPVMKIIGGRGKDLILTKDGLKGTYISLYLNRYGLNRFKQLQVIQLSLNKLIIKVVPTPEYRGDEDSRLLEKVCQEEFNDEFSVRVELVEEIPPTESCKNKMVISQLAVDYLRQQQSS